MEQKRQNENNCSTVIIGKNASKTGTIIMGHNEDDEDVYVQCHIVPHQIHDDAETICFADSDLTFPQVKETLGYYWSEVRKEGGISFADSFVNECGVVIVSDSCPEAKEASEERTPKMKYALRRLLAERAHSAKEAVLIAAALIEEYGYDSSRTYHIADHKEAWTLSVPRGFRCAARRIGDDEIYFMPNHFVIHEIEYDDPDNYYASSDLISFAKKQGWYLPKREDESDFDFADCYQGTNNREVDSNRFQDAWKRLAGLSLSPDAKRITTYRADRKYDVSDVKELLRSHGEEEPSDPHSTDIPFQICNYATIESTIFVFSKEVQTLKMYRALPKPCLSPYVPWYPLVLKKIPEGYETLDTETSIKTHFSPELKLEEEKAYAWNCFQRVLAHDVTDQRRDRKKQIEQMEAQWEMQEGEILKQYDREKDVSILERFTEEAAETALHWAELTASESDF